MSEYDGLELDTPTLIDETDDVEVWATRTKNGGTVEHRVKAGSDADRARQLEARLDQAIAANKAYIDLTSRTNAQVAAQVLSLTRQLNALLRLQRGVLDTVD